MTTWPSYHVLIEMRLQLGQKLGLGQVASNALHDLSVLEEKQRGNAH